jgi:hypothetical protein
MRMLRPFVVIPLFTALLAAGSASPALAQQVVAEVETISVSEIGTSADVQFRVTATNGEASVAVNVKVVWEDGVETNVGDVAPGGSAASATEQRIFDTSAMPTRNFPVPVTVRFTLDGVDVALAQTLIVGLGAPAAPPEPEQ